MAQDPYAEQFYVLREHGTERAGTSPLDKNYTPGTYDCAACDLPLYSSDAKFNSGTGWPSFFKPLDNAVGTSVEKSFFFVTRTEVHCRRCGGHLGHVFEDGPPPTGLRYCNEKWRRLEVRAKGNRLTRQGTGCLTSRVGNPKTSVVDSNSCDAQQRCRGDLARWWQSG